MVAVSVVVVVVTDAAVDVAAAFTPAVVAAGSRGEKNDSAASFVRYFPLHFSLSVNGVVK